MKIYRLYLNLFRTRHMGVMVYFLTEYEECAEQETTSFHVCKDTVICNQSKSFAQTGKQILSAADKQWAVFALSILLHTSKIWYT
jgi:hypothetical protein